MIQHTKIHRIILNKKLFIGNILNPEWVTKGVYKILNDNRLMTEFRALVKSDQEDRKIFITISALPQSHKTSLSPPRSS
ncbi:hypothetical protein [Nostoc sp.]|uniref:hypothetical protein n=1 Tax=Nostoc sp. TaxID=1180 RepID=UPI002FFBF4CE